MNIFISMFTILAVAAFVVLIICTVRCCYKRRAQIQHGLSSSTSTLLWDPPQGNQ